MMDTVKLSFLAHPGGWAGVGVGMPALFRRFRLGGEGCRLGGEGPPGEEWLGLEKGLDVELEVKDVAVLPRRETCWPRLGQQSVCIVLRRMSSTHTMHCPPPPPPNFSLFGEQCMVRGGARPANWHLALISGGAKGWQAGVNEMVLGGAYVWKHEG